jgi:hypothetical protein
MLPSVPATVSALAYSIIRERCGDDGSGYDLPHNRVVQFVLEQHSRMPDYLRLPIRCATLALDALPVPFRLRPLHLLQHEERWRVVTRMRESRIGPFRDLIKFYESLVVFAWHGEVEARRGKAVAA